MSSEETLGAALQALALGRRADAGVLLEGAHALHMASALLTLLASDTPTGAYDQAKAFEAFIRSGGNVALYNAVSSFLARSYDRHVPVSLLDIGVGDGLALIPALAQTRNAPNVIDVVEPNAELLRSLSKRLALRTAHALGLKYSRKTWQIITGGTWRSPRLPCSRCPQTSANARCGAWRPTLACWWLSSLIFPCMRHGVKGSIDHWRVVTNRPPRNAEGTPLLSPPVFSGRCSWGSSVPPHHRTGSKQRALGLMNWHRAVLRTLPSSTSMITAGRRLWASRRGLATLRPLSLRRPKVRHRSMRCP